MTKPMTYLDAALYAQTVAKVRYEELQEYRQRYPTDKGAQSNLQTQVTDAYRQARVCYDMWGLHLAGVPGEVIRDWVHGRGWLC